MQGVPGVPGVREKSMSESGNSLVDESILKKDKRSVTRICSAVWFPLLPLATPTRAVGISAKVAEGAA